MVYLLVLFFLWSSSIFTVETVIFFSYWIALCISQKLLGDSFVGLFLFSGYLLFHRLCGLGGTIHTLDTMVYSKSWNLVDSLYFPKLLRILGFFWSFDRNFSSIKKFVGILIYVKPVYKLENWPLLLSRFLNPWIYILT